MADAATERYFRTGLFEPDILMPVQWEALCARDQFAPIRRLYLAVLEDGVETLRRYAGEASPKSRQLADDARAWFEDWSGRRGVWVVTCEQAVLGAGLRVDPEVLARRVLSAYPSWDRKKRLTHMQLNGNRNYLGPRRYAAPAEARV